MEFKALSEAEAGADFSVDIVTEWNLKFTELSILERDYGVDIVTEWNLKTDSFTATKPQNLLI